jgi:type VI secretion system secreted protein VgrG
MPQPITLATPLPPEDLRFASVTATEGLSTLGEARLNMISPKESIDPHALLGKPVTVKMTLRDDAKRYLHGYVTRFALTGHSGRFYTYQAVVRPWLWFLKQTVDCRIFQEQSVPDIVKKVFEDHRIANFEFKLFRSYRKWTYCVQYRESDYDFVARLLEHEGIYWYVQHGDGQHKLVLVDSQTAHDAAPNYESLPFYENGSSAPPDTEYVSRWRFSSSVAPGQVTLRSYDFERPSTDLKVDKTHARASHDLADYEVFDYQGDYIQAADGRQLSEDRLDEMHTQALVQQGDSNAQGIEVGRLLKLTSHPRENQNAEYLVTAISLHAQTDAVESGRGGSSALHCEFNAIPSKQQFRPERRTRKPVVHGPQTAVVVGPGGEEIFTDKYGRVKVQFHWDREAKKKDSKDKSSCWVRVSQPWAGKNFGMIHIPRIGQEVVVGFLEGDPDQPLITGRVYNAEQMPPWDLPANATQSGILTRSSKGGGYANANAIRFEDKAGAEQLWIHAEKNQDIEVENDETHWVGHDRTKTIDHDETVHVKHDRTETVDHDETIVVHHDRKERVDHDEEISIGRDRTMLVERDKTETVKRNKTITVEGRHLETVAQTMEISVGASLSETVAVNYSQTVGAAMELTVGAALAVTVGGAMTETVGATKAFTVGGSLNENIGSSKSTSVGTTLSETVNKSMSLKVGENLDETVSGKHTISVTKEFLLKAEDELSLKCGSAEIMLKKNGDITISGGKINIKGSGDVTVKGSKIAGN